MDTNPVKRIPVKVFDIQHQIHSSCGSGASVVSEMATSVDGGSSASENVSNKQQNFSLVKLFMKQKSSSAEGNVIFYIKYKNSVVYNGNVICCRYVNWYGSVISE